MDDPESLQVRDLEGEGLDLLAPGSPAARTRFLVETGEMPAARDDADILVIDTWTMRKRLGSGTSRRATPAPGAAPYTPSDDEVPSEARVGE